MDDYKEVILTRAPESGFWQRFYNMLIAPIVPEMLLSCLNEKCLRRPWSVRRQL